MILPKDVQRAVERARAEGIRVSLVAIENDMPSGVCISKSTGEKYEVTLDACTCQAFTSGEGKLCKHRVALAMATNRLNHFAVSDEDITAMARTAVSRSVEFRTKNPQVGKVVSSYVYGEPRPEGLPTDEVGHVVFERESQRTVESGIETFVLMRDGTVGRGPFREFTTRRKDS